MLHTFVHYIFNNFALEKSGNRFSPNVQAECYIYEGKSWTTTQIFTVYGDADGSEGIVKGPMLYCFSSISHSCQRSNNTVLFDPESDPEGEAPEEIQTLQLQQDVSESLVCLNNVSLFVCLYVLQLLPCI